MSTSIFMDQALARRLERAEGVASSTFVEVRQQIAPEVGSVWHDFDGTYAMYDGPESPMTQTFGLGMFAPADPERLGAIERFFADRGADAQHEVSPLAGVDVLALLVDRGYRPTELSTVLVRPLDVAFHISPPAGLVVRQCGAEDRERWIAASVAGWSAAPGMEAMARAASQNRLAVNFLVERAGEVIATGSLVVHDRIGLLAGASTIPSGRGQGAQGMLLAARLGEARRHGCELAMIVAEPGSTSQRNAERRGFHVAYTRSKWRQRRS